MPQSRDSLLQGSLLRFVRRGAWDHAGRLLEKSHPADIARVLDRLTEADRRAVFDLIRSPQVRAEVLPMLEFAARADLLVGMQPESSAGILQLMDTDDAADVLRELPRDEADAIIGSLGERADEIESLLQYPEGIAGAIMVPDYFALNENLTAKEAVEHLQSRGTAEASFYVYVVDDRGYLVGVLSLRQLIIQPPYTVLRDCMVIDPIRVTVDTDQEEVARIVARYDLLAVPVVDSRNELVGVVTVDDVIDVMRDEATEDILKLAGTTVEEVTRPGILRGAWIRFPWLAASFVGGAGGIFLLARYESLLTTTVQIAFFLPIILGMGGNVGSQCSMVVVRGLATGRLELDTVPRIILHEVGTSVLLAVTFAATLGGVAAVLGYGPRAFPLVVALGMFISMLTAATVGTLLPLIFDRLGADPAVASGPFVTTSTDVAGIAGFCLVAFWLL
jgi:magnesium transporter